MVRDPDFAAIARANGQNKLTLRLPIMRETGKFRSGLIGDPKSGGIRWFPAFETAFESMDELPLGTIIQIKENMKEVGSKILRRAQSEAKWKDHPERHRGVGATVQIGRGHRLRRGSGANAKWPHNRTAREGLFVYVRQRKLFVELGLSHDPQTVYIRSDGQRFNYGAALETGFDGRFAIIAPTLAKFHNETLNACSGTFSTRKTVKPKPNFGGQTIASGWFKQGKD